jgi:hypothetical protein
MHNCRRESRIAGSIEFVVEWMEWGFDAAVAPGFFLTDFAFGLSIWFEWAIAPEWWVVKGLDG